MEHVSKLLLEVGSSALAWVFWFLVPYSFVCLEVRLFSTVCFALLLNWTLYFVHCHTLIHVVCCEWLVRSLILVRLKAVFCAQRILTCSKVYAMRFCVVCLYCGFLNRTAPINAWSVIPACNSNVPESPYFVSKLPISTGITISPTAWPTR
jgi:hypothetical protein